MKRFNIKTNKGTSLIELIVTVAIISSLAAVMAPVYIHTLEEAKVVADSTLLQDALNLAISMEVMQEENASQLYYTKDATLVTSTSKLEAYGNTSDTENSIVMVYKENDLYKAKWINIK